MRLWETASTSYFELTTGITLAVARQFSTDYSDSNPAPETGDGQHVEDYSYSALTAQICSYKKGASAMLVRLGRHLYSTSVRRVGIVSGL